MIEQDTIKLLRECDAGVKMGVDAIEQVLPDVTSEQMRHCLTASLHHHQSLDRDIQKALDRFSDDGKDPNPIASAMSWMKTGAVMAVKPSDASAADLMTDGCNMGVKSLSRYLNRYGAADEDSKGIAKRLISMEEQLAVDLRPYL